MVKETIWLLGEPSPKSAGFTNDPPVFRKRLAAPPSAFTSKQAVMPSKAPLSGFQLPPSDITLYVNYSSTGVDDKSTMLFTVCRHTCQLRLKKQKTKKREKSTHPQDTPPKNNNNTAITHTNKCSSPPQNSTVLHTLPQTSYMQLPSEDSRLPVNHVTLVLKTCCCSRSFHAITSERAANFR